MSLEFETNTNSLDEKVPTAYRDNRPRQKIVRPNRPTMAVVMAKAVMAKAAAASHSLRSPSGLVVRRRTKQSGPER